MLLILISNFSTFINFITGDDFDLASHSLSPYGHKSPHLPFIDLWVREVKLMAMLANWKFYYSCNYAPFVELWTFFVYNVFRLEIYIKKYFNDENFEIRTIQQMSRNKNLWFVFQMLMKVNVMAPKMFQGLNLEHDNFIEEFLLSSKYKAFYAKISLACKFKKVLVKSQWTFRWPFSSSGDISV